MEELKFSVMEEEFVLEERYFDGTKLANIEVYLSIHFKATITIPENCKPIYVIEER